MIDSTGSQNLMMDEMLIIEEKRVDEIDTCIIRQANLGETCNQSEKKQLLQFYLNQLEISQKFKDVWGNLSINYCVEDLSEEIEYNFYKCKSELLEWENIWEDLNPVLQQDKIEGSISKIMLDACIRVPAYVDKLSDSVKKWMKNDNTKYFLERDHSYQLSLLAIKQEDFMKALYYIDKDLKNINFGQSRYGQHCLVQKIMKNYECRQFLDIMKKIGFEDEETLKSQVFESIESWLKRTPNIVYDPLNVWDDIMTSRHMYLDTYEKAFTGFHDELKENKNLADIRSLLYLQTARGAKDMTLYDSSEKYLKKAVDSCLDLHWCTPLIVDLKIKQYMNLTRYLNQDLNDNIKRLKKIEEVIKRQKKSDDQDSNISLSKLALLLADIKQLIMEVVLHHCKESNSDDESHYADAMQKTLRIYETIITKAENNRVQDNQSKRI
jgi:hypothetical protein